MNENLEANSLQSGSSIQIDILIEESWVDQLISEQKLVIPINENTHLTHIKLILDLGMLHLQADIEEKEGSSLEISVTPAWEAIHQKLQIENFEIHTKSKNLFVKSAGWFSNHFMNAKLDKKIEDQINFMYSVELEKIKKQTVKIPFPGGGIVEADISDVTIYELIFIEHAVLVKASIEGAWKLKLQG